MPFRRSTGTLLLACLGLAASARPGVEPMRAQRAMVVSASGIASAIGLDVLSEGGSAVDAAVATAFALAVVHPTAGNIGGGGFLLLRPAAGDPVVYDFREVAPTGSHPRMFERDGAYDAERHHEGHRAVGVPGSVAGLHLAWSDHGRLSWRRLLAPAVELARRGFAVSDGLSRSLASVLPEMRQRGYAASVAQFSRAGEPYREGDLLRQPDLGRTLERIAEQGPDGFYRGETARLIDAEMRAHGGLIGPDDLARYRPLRRAPVRGSYRGHGVLGVPPISSGGTTLIGILNILEGYDLQRSGFGSAATVHLIVEAMRRAFADRARHLGDPAFHPELPLARLLSKAHAAALRATISPARASVSSPERFEWPAEGEETTHLSIVDEERNAVAMTTTLEQGYGSKIVVPGGGFLLNNEMGDFNAAPGLTDAEGRIGTAPNLAAPRKRMLSSMSPTILERGGRPYFVTGSLGGRAIINVVLLTILNVVDFGMNAQEAIDAPRFHHQWLPDRVLFERHGLSPDTRALLEARGHALEERDRIGVAHAILVDPESRALEAGTDRRLFDAAARGR